MTREEYLRRYKEENRAELNEKARKAKYSLKWSIANPESAMLSSCKAQAKKRGIPFSLEKSDIVIPETCPVLGIPLFKNIGGKTMGPNSPSLDKIIPELGYIKGNVQVISQRANVMKNDASIEELERFANWVLNRLIPSLKT